MSRGCLFGSLILLFIWLFGGWWLWQASLKAPPGDGAPLRFEIIPGSDERTSPDDVDDTDSGGAGNAR